MKTVILSLFILLLVIGCQKDIAIGYLNAANALYSPDSLVVKAKLDEEESNRTQNTVAIQRDRRGGRDITYLLSDMEY